MDDSAGLHRPDHAAAVSDELAWLSAAIDARLTAFFADQDAPVALPDPPPLNPATALGDLTIRADLDPAGRLVLALALAPHVDAAVLDPFHVRNTAIGRAFSQFGGHHGADGFHPTIATALFLVAGAATRDRIEAMGLFAPDHPLRRDVGLSLRTGQGAGAAHGAILDLPPHRAVALCSGVAPPPDVAPGFPAQRLTTRLDWSDLVLPDDLMHRLGHIEAWLRHRPVILSDWGLSRQVGGGFKALFHGPPGTGKTLTAALLGKRTGLDVYRIDLSMVVSKYIGETEKNLGLVFDMAAERDWILFFDEADALFGARTTTTTANDRYANQEVSYLLQRIEACESLVLLATNLRTNIDDAFFRRFQMSLGFTRPDRRQRLRLWESVLRDVPLDRDVDVPALAGDCDLSGAAIANVARHAAISALRRGAEAVARADLRDAVALEMRKEGRTS